MQATNNPKEQDSWIEKGINTNYLKYYDYNDFNNFQEVGSGAFGKVYRANYKNFNQYFAIKSFLKFDDVTLKEIVREVKLQREVDFFKNIIRLYGITSTIQVIHSVEIKSYSLVLEYADGGSLRSYLKNNFNGLTWNNKYDLAYQLASAVSLLHSEGIVHRDLHSGNILIHQSNIKLADFGLSKRIDEGSRLLSKTFGSLPYVDPKGNTHNNEESRKLYDVFSLGVLFWEISSGCPPFKDRAYDHYLAISIAQGHRETIVPGTPVDYSNLYTECWDNEPRNRPATNQVVERLKEMISKVDPNLNQTQITVDEVQKQFSISRFLKTYSKKKEKTKIIETNSIKSYEQQSREQPPPPPPKDSPPQSYTNSFSSLKLTTSQLRGHFNTDKANTSIQSIKKHAEYSTYNDNIRAVIAIDLGVNYSGFAYANKANLGQIITNETWPEQIGPLKTNTALRYDENFKNVEEWGYPALAKRPRRGKTNNKPSVERFLLHLGDIPENEKPNLPKGITYKKAITDYLQSMGKLIKDTTYNRWPNIKFMEQALIILTIPAEFSDKAKTILRECVYDAGLIPRMSPNHLQFITKPEAAAVYCMKSISLNTVGTSFLIVDCGSDTVDLTTLQLLTSEEFGEKKTRTGGFCGGAHVDKEFIKFIKEKVGTSAVTKFQDDHYGQLQYMVQEFCKKVKLLFTGNKNDYRNFEIDLDILCPAIKQYVDSEKYDQLDDNEWIVDLDFEDVKKMFDPVIDKIIRLIHQQLDLGDSVSVIFLVGGFSGSKYLQKRVLEVFSDGVKRISVPAQPMAAAVRGAIMASQKFTKI